MSSEPERLIQQGTGESVYGEQKLKIALVCSHGGHLTQLEALWAILSDYDCFLVTHRCKRTEGLELAQRKYFFQEFRPLSPSRRPGEPGPVHLKYLLLSIGNDIWLMAKAFFRAAVILLQERPDVLISTGSEIAIPFFWIGKLMHTKTVYIETWARTRTRSVTGRMVYPVANLFLVQWPALLSLYGPKARYEGSVV
jgi:UDP-N-acetylglucosamine:LPS N-acetylglucosamine transferase